MKSLVFAAFLLLASMPVEGREKLSARDSLRLKRFVDSAFSSPLFSRKRDTWLDSALSITPTRAYYWQQKSMPLDKAGKYELALPYLDSAVKYDATEYLDYRAFCKCIFHKNYRGALIDFHDAKALNGNIGLMDHPYDFYIGLCHLQLNDLDSAGNYFDRCIEAKRKKGGDNAVHYLHWFYRGIVYTEKTQQAMAIECFDKSLKQYTNFSDAKYYKAASLTALGQYAEALRYAMEAQNDFREGYTMNEDNALYERYPYQIRKYYLEGTVKYLKQKAAEQIAVDPKRLFKLPSGDTLKQYFFVMLKKGPKRSQITDTATINRIQQGHMENIGRLAKLGKLRVAGPFDEDDIDWRGIFIFDVDTKKEVEALLNTDPAISSGRLAYEIHPWWTQAGTVIR
jgi:tetratricopeptide (TPR) repeat protein